MENASVPTFGWRIPHEDLHDAIPSDRPHRPFFMADEPTVKAWFDARRHPSWFCPWMLGPVDDLCVSDENRNTSSERRDGKRVHPFVSRTSHEDVNSVLNGSILCVVRIRLVPIPPRSSCKPVDRRTSSSNTERQIQARRVDTLLASHRYSSSRPCREAPRVREKDHKSVVLVGFVRSVCKI